MRSPWADKVYNDIPFADGEEELYNIQNTQYKELVRLTRDMAEIKKAKDPKAFEHYKELIAQRRQSADDHRVKLKAVIDFQSNEAKKWVSEAEKAISFATLLTLVITVVGFVGSSLIGWIFARGLAKSLANVTERLSTSGDRVSVASDQLSASSEQLSSGATQAAASLEETVASVEELSSMVKQNADNAKEAASLSGTSKESAESGESEMKKLNLAMTDIAESSKKIEEIINVIDDIAFQTNLLALNAAVEAARAGDQGKGFAVVAEAVRALAQRSASAAKEITTLIKDSVTKIDRGTRIADDSSVALKSIVTSVKKVADLNNEIAAASSEQASGLAQISQAMNELDQATQRNASAAQECSSASEEMSEQAGSVRHMVGELLGVVRGAGHQEEVQQQQSAVQQQRPAKARQPVAMVKNHAPARVHNAKVVAMTSRVRTKASAEEQLPMSSEEPQVKLGNTNGF